MVSHQLFDTCLYPTKTRNKNQGCHLHYTVDLTSSVKTINKGEDQLQLVINEL